jgi:Asp-tRNA(Asn)/Glu-tRNA(Gln) amidotransferase A subunit family amidase
LGAYPVRAYFCSLVVCDHLGFFSPNVADMAAIWSLFAKNNLKAPLNGLEGVKIALADDYFQQGAEPEVFEAVTAIAERLGVSQKITIPETARRQGSRLYNYRFRGSKLAFTAFTDQIRGF